MPLIMGISDRVYCLEAGNRHRRGRTGHGARQPPGHRQLSRHRRAGHQPERRRSGAGRRRSRRSVRRPPDPADPSRSADPRNLERPAGVTSGSTIHRGGRSDMTVGIVTGAARGMGAACAARVADMVDVLLLVDRDEVLLATQADMLAAAGHRAAAGTLRPRRQGSRRHRPSRGPGGGARPAARRGPCRRPVADHGGLAGDPHGQPGRHGAARRGLPCPGGAGDRGRLLRVGGGVARPRPGRPARRTPCSTTRWPTDFLEKHPRGGRS